MRKLDPLSTNLVVADTSRTEKTICLAVSPSLKNLGVPSRPRLFEVISTVEALNAERLHEAIRQKKAVIRDGKPGFSIASFDATALKNDISLEIAYIIARPHMALYEDVSARIYSIYLKYISPDDILVYSIDEVFIDATQYLDLYQMDAHKLAMTMIRDVLYTTGITATAGIGPNMFLAKVAMDIVAKKVPPDKDGVRIASLDELSFRKLMWTHEPLTDFWRIGKGISRKLNKMGLYTLGDVARCSLGRDDEYYNEDLLYKAFGINAELLIDHAWGYESCRMSDAKKYVPQLSSLSTGQVLPKPYTFEKARNIVIEMTDTLVLDLTKKDLITDRMALGIGYDATSLIPHNVNYKGRMRLDHYKRLTPEGVHISRKLSGYVSGMHEIRDCVLDMFDERADPDLFVRSINIVACDVKPRSSGIFTQLSLFADCKNPAATQTDIAKELRLQEAIIKIRTRYGKNYLIKGINLREDSRERERNELIGGHRA